MRPIVSPFRLEATKARSIKDWLLGSRWLRYRDSIRSQLSERGPVPDSAWGDPKRLEVARKIEAILGEVCWDEQFHFAPDDPYEMNGVGS